MTWCVFNKNYVQILDKIVQFNSHGVCGGHYTGTTVSTVSANFQHYQFSSSKVTIPVSVYYIQAFVT